MAVQTNGKWYTGIVLTYAENSGFWDRDNALFTKSWREAGMDSKFIALGEPGIDPKLPLILANHQQMADPKWWGQLGIEGIVFTTWGLPRFEPIARAIKAAGIKLILIMDSDGLLGPRVCLKEYLWRKCASERDAGRPLAMFSAVAKTLLAMNKSYWRRTLDHLAHADRIGVQSPLAVEFYKRFFAEYGRPDLMDRVIFVPHATTDDMRYSRDKPKSAEIVSVGRWDTVQKNAPLLVRALAQLFERESEYSAVIIGKGEGRLKSVIATLPSGMRPRFKIVGRVPHEQLAHQYQRAQIFISSSRYETFGIAAAEALCCGCSVVGPTYIPPFHYFTSQASGALAYDRSPGAFADALATEIAAWRNGQRDAARISEFWCGQVHAQRVAERLLQAGRAISR